MSKLKTRGAKGDTVYLTGSLQVLQQVNKYEYAVQLKIMRDGVNNNKWDYRNIETYYKTFLGRPILCAFVNGEVGDGHNMRETIDPATGKKYHTFTDATAERIVGIISDDEKDITLVKEGGHTWIVAKGRLFSFYAPEVVRKIASTGKMEVSAETDVQEGHSDGDIDVFTVWVGLGVTVLGDLVAPAIPGANIAKLAALENEFKELKLKAASLRQEPQNPDGGNIMNKGVKTLKQATLKQLASLAPKFPNYKILGATEDLKHVALMSADGNMATYSFLDEDKGEVVAARVCPIALSADLSFGEDKTLCLSVDEITDAMGAQITTLSANLETAKADLTAANATITAMRESEHRRRVESIKTAVNAKAEKVKSNSTDDVLGDSAENICANSEQYAEMTDAKGDFCGDVKACADLMAAVGERVIALNEAAKAKAKTTYIWETQGASAPAATGIEASLAFINQ